MSHLVGHVLPAPEPLWVDTDLGQEEVCSSKEVTESLVVYGTLQVSLRHSPYPAAHVGNGISNSHLGQISLSTKLDLLWQQAQFDILDLVESGMSLVEGIDIVFNLCHQEFTNSE